MELPLKRTIWDLAPPSIFCDSAPSNLTKITTTTITVIVELAWLSGCSCSVMWRTDSNFVDNDGWNLGATWCHGADCQLS
jgi:hypothetical protein